MLVSFVLAGALIAFALWSFVEAASAIAAAMLILDGAHSEAGGRDPSNAFSAGVWWALLSVGAAFAAGVIL